MDKRVIIVVCAVVGAFALGTMYSSVTPEGRDVACFTKSELSEDVGWGTMSGRACEFVNQSRLGSDKAKGCWEICEGLASYVKVSEYYESDNRSVSLDKVEDIPMWVSFDDVGYALANACAVVLHGAEY